MQCTSYRVLTVHEGLLIMDHIDQISTAPECHSSLNLALSLLITLL